MRWTNYFLHPADNRYYVFTFREEVHADRFELSLKKDGVPYERSEKEFGVPRTHFNEALRHNHLLHAENRKPFIENKGLRYTILIVTAAMVLLAVVGALTSKAHAQQLASNYGWELAIQGRVNAPFAEAGVDGDSFTESGLSCTWTPLIGQSFGVRINHRLKESWTLGTGIEWIRRNYQIEIAYANDTLGINTLDTIPLLRAACYRIPIMAETRVEIGNRFFVTAGGGIGLEFSPSDAFVNGYTNEPLGSEQPSRDYEAYLGRTRWGSLPIMAEVGIEKAPKVDKPGYYLGVFFSRSVGSAYWVDNVWDGGGARVRGTTEIASTLAGVELRLLLK